MGTIGENSAHRVSLRQDAVDELRTVAARDDEVLGALSEEAATPLDGDSPAIPLRVDHHHTRRPDHDMVDVPAASRHSAIVEEDDAMTCGPTFELAGELDLPLRTPCPCALMLRFVAERPDDSGERSVPFSPARLLAIATTRVLAPRTRTRRELNDSRRR
jgi:hypothetical protein